MSCLSRRDFLKFLGYSLLMSQVPYSPVVKKAQASINPLDWVNLLDLNCVSCSVNITGCIKITLKGVKIAPRINYWIPEAFIESTKKFQFGKSLPLADLITTAVSPLTDLLAPFVPTGTYGLNSFGDQNTYMKLYPHWFGFPPAIVTAIKTAIMALNNLNPICLSCNLANSVVSHLVPVLEVQRQFQEQLKPLMDKMKKIQELKQKYNNIMNAFSNVNRIIPFFPSELFFFIWMLEQFSPDNYTVAPLFNSIIQTATQLSQPLGALICPTLTQRLGKFLDLPFGIEASFICVGRWGFGYPRIGIVRHDDPVVAGLLSIARFHHLFTKTIPLIRPKFSFSRIKYQMYSPSKTGCFRIGYFADDPIAKALFRAEGVAQNITDVLTNPTELLGEAKSFVREGMSKAINGVLAPHKQRTVGVVVWKNYNKCCW